MFPQSPFLYQDPVDQTSLLVSHEPWLADNPELTCPLYQQSLSSVQLHRNISSEFLKFGRILLATNVRMSLDIKQQSVPSLGFCFWFKERHQSEKKISVKRAVKVQFQKYYQVSFLIILYKFTNYPCITVLMTQHSNQYPCSCWI